MNKNTQNLSVKLPSILVILLASGFLSPVSPAEHPGEPLGDNSKDSKTFFELLQEGERYTEFHQFDLAQPLLEKAVEAAPLDTRARISFAKNSLEKVKLEVFGQAREARKKLEKSKEGEASAAKEIKGLDARSTEAQDLAEAIPDIGLSPEQTEALEDAEKHLKVALKLSERRDQKALQILGQNYFLRREWAEAEKIFEEDLRLDSGDYMTSRWLREIRRQQDRIKRDEEEEAIRKAEEEEEAKKKK